MSNKSTSKKSQTNFEKLHSMNDEDIDFTDLPETTPEMWEKGFVRKGLNSRAENGQETLAIDRDIIDRDIIEFFKSQGRGYREKINELLRAYMEAHQTK